MRQRKLYSYKPNRFAYLLATDPVILAANNLLITALHSYRRTGKTTLVTRIPPFVNELKKVIKSRLRKQFGNKKKV